MEGTVVITTIDAALERMRQRGHDSTVHYRNLQAKRFRVASGASYRIVDVAPALVACVGAGIAGTNTSTKDQRLSARSGSLSALYRELEEEREARATWHFSQVQHELFDATQYEQRGLWDLESEAS